MKRVALPVLLVAALVSVWLLLHRAPPPATTADAESRPGPDAAAAMQATANTASDPVAPRAALGDDPHEAWIVRGRVLMARDTPYPGARAVLRSFAGTEAAGEPLVASAIVCDASGSFACALAAPTVTVTLELAGAMPEHASSTRTWLVPKGAPAPQNLEIWISPRDRFAVGTVTDERGQPIAGAWVRCQGDPIPTAPDGSFRVPFANGFGENAMLRAGAPGFVSAAQPLAKTSEIEVRADLVLRAALRIEGRVVDEQGAAVAGATVTSFTALRDPVQSEADGGFAIATADPVEPIHTLFARKTGYAEGRARVDGRQPQAVEIVLRRGVRVVGRVVGPDGAPVAGASLELRTLTSHDVAAVSRDDGSFDLPSVTPGPHVLWTRCTGFAPDVRSLQVPGDQIELRADVQLGAAHFLAGTVVDEAGAPVPRIEVRALVKDPGAEHPLPDRAYLDTDTVSGPDGAFRMDDLPAGSVDVEALGARVLRSTLAAVAVDRSDVRLVVRRAAKLAGRVVDAESGAPIREFRIRLMRAALNAGEKESLDYGADWSRPGIAFRSDDGAWSTRDIDLLEPGSIAGVEATAAGYAPCRITRVVAEISPSPDACVLRMQRGGTITGRVVSAAGGDPIAGARVLQVDDLRPLTSDREDASTRLSATTSADGSFTLAPVPPGRVTLVIESTRFPSHQDGPFEVASGAPIERVVLVPDGASIAGRLLDPEGRALPRTRVTLQPPAPRKRLFQESDAEGRFRFDALSAGEYVLTATAVRMGVSFPFHRSLHLEGAQALQVDLQPAGACVLRGRLVGAGVAGFEFAVSLKRTAPNGGDESYTGECSGGRFEMRGLPAGEYVGFVYAVQQFGRNGRVQCTLREDEVAEIDVEIPAH